jgi:diguanylate cyclase (GGDEF)-like protein
MSCSHVSGMVSPLENRLVYLINSPSNRTIWDQNRQRSLIGCLSMKLCVTAIATVLGWAVTALAAQPSALTTLRTIHTLNNADVKLAQPVAFEATVIYSRGYENLLFVQDGSDAIYVRPPPGTQLAAGDRILIRGKMQASFRPLVIGQSVSLLRHGASPRATPATFDELIRAQHDCLLVSVHAVVRAADLVVSPVALIRSARLQLVTEGGHFEANIETDDISALKDLLDAEVEITGAAAGKFDDKMQQAGVVLYVSSLTNIKILKPAGANRWLLPVTPMDRVLTVYHMNDLTPRVRVEGTITYYQPGSAIVLQDGSKSLWIEIHTREPLQIGDQADATGFPDAHDRLLTLTDGEIRDRQIFQPVRPQLATWHQLGYWSSNTADGHMYDLVSIEGKVETEVREASQDEYVLNSDGRLFTAIYRHPPSPNALPAMTRIPLGSRIRVTGICVIEQAITVKPGEEAPFNILLRSFDDISVVASPSLLSIRNLSFLVGLLLVVVIVGGARTLVIERKVRRKTAAAAYIERRRSSILEDINGSRPVDEILEQITELTSFRLDGAPCWCQLNGRATLGNRPPKLSSLRIVEEVIPARSGPPPGVIVAAFDALAKPRASESEALSATAALASVAIETRRLYSDLRRRSEFDQLTDIHNRFSLEAHLDSLMDEARREAGMFGLIYIDLDKFKEVNDQYGHRVGDCYLQEAAARMKRQLRAQDILARLGGDEFAVLVSMVSSRADAEEIAYRLDRCFDQPFAVEGCILNGSASVGLAIFPQDGSTKDGLLSAADAVMYIAKNTKHHVRASA